MIQVLYNIMWSQCSKLIPKKNAVADFQVNMTDKGDVVTLLQEIMLFKHKMDAKIFVKDVVDETKRRYYTYHQGKKDSNTKHLQS